jgi:hypothetical protein
MYSMPRGPRGRKTDYFARFLGLARRFPESAALCGVGGVPSIRRNTSSGFGSGVGCSCFMAGV